MCGVDYIIYKKIVAKKVDFFCATIIFFFISLYSNSNGGVGEYRLVTLAEIIHIAPVQIMLTLEVWSHL